ncbi:MAG TPA: HdeD family acid-resistance protein [Woeseiaceae bacterium]|nr:HdeD family acid-resistance protein [Woeseiaceae bacterium]
MSDKMPTISNETITNEVRRHSAWFLIVGIVAIVLGLAALVFPKAATTAVELLVGSILTVYGALGAKNAFRHVRWNRFLWSLFGALFAFGAGLLLLLFPMTGVLSLTLLVAAFFLASGSFRVLLAVRLRPADRWVWLLLSGLLAITLAVAISVHWPELDIWVIGLLLGIDLIFSGFAAVLLAQAARRIV